MEFHIPIVREGCLRPRPTLASYPADFRPPSTLASYGTGFGLRAALGSYGDAGRECLGEGFVSLGVGKGAHGGVEGQAEDLDVEVNGVAGPVALGPTPVAVFDDQPGISGQDEVARLAGDELEAAVLESRGQGGCELDAEGAWARARGGERNAERKLLVASVDVANFFDSVLSTGLWS